MMLDEVAAIVETVDRPAATSDTKAAIAYLIAAGTTAISVLETETGRALFRVGAKIDPHAVAFFWIAAPAAIGVARRARKLAGENPRGDEAIVALRQAAAERRATLSSPLSTSSETPSRGLSSRCEIRRRRPMSPPSMRPGVPTTPRRRGRRLCSTKLLSRPEMRLRRWSSNSSMRPRS